MKTKNNWIKNLLFQLCLTASASVLFTLSHPNPLIENGIPLLAWIAYIPILLLIQRNSILMCAGWGAIYGYLTYLLFNYWLTIFHPMAGVTVYTIYLVFLAAVFLFFKLADIFYPKKAYLVQWMIWIAYEFMCTKGFLGYPYGITGYSQWQIIPLIQIASITGVWGVSALVAFPSFWLAAAFKNQTGILSNSIFEITSSIAAFFKKEKVSAIVWAAALIFSFVYGITYTKDIPVSPSVQIALIQHNSYPWDSTNATTS
jgi:apolipoprotein N-acyltransferase